MPPELRALVHEFGYAIVNAFLVCGVRKVSTIRHLVMEVWAGARQPSQVGGAEGTLDWVLMQAGAEINAAKLERLLADFNLRIVPAEPSREMIEASMAEVSDFTQRITKREKHRRRLTAAIKACAWRFKMATEKAA